MIFTQQEQADCIKFCQFFNHNFKIKPKTAFRHNLTAADFLDIYQVVNPNTELCQLTMEHILTHGGYQFEDKEGVPCAVRQEEFQLLPEKVQKRIIYYATKPYEVQLAQLMRTLPKGIVPKSIHMFLTLYVYHKQDFKYFDMLEAPRQRTAVVELYKYYSNICIFHKWHALSKADFVSVLEHNGYTKHQAYCYTGDKKQGTLAFLNIAIPYDIEEQSISIKDGLSVMYIRGKWACNDSKLVADFLDADFYKKYREGRIEEAGKAYGNEQEETQTEESGALDWTKTKILRKSSQGREGQDTSSSNTNATNDYTGGKDGENDGRNDSNDSRNRPKFGSNENSGDSRNKTTSSGGRLVSKANQYYTEQRTDYRDNEYASDTDNSIEGDGGQSQSDSQKVEYPINIDEGIYNDLFDICSEEIRLTKERAEEIIDEYNAEYKTNVDIDDVWDTLKEALL